MDPSMITETANLVGLGLAGIFLLSAFLVGRAKSHGLSFILIVLSAACGLSAVLQTADHSETIAQHVLETLS